MEGNPGNCTLRHDAVALTVNKINAACIKLMIELLVATPKITTMLDWIVY